MEKKRHLPVCVGLYTVVPKQEKILFSTSLSLSFPRNMFRGPAPIHGGVRVQNTPVKLSLSSAHTGINVLKDQKRSQKQKTHW